MINIYCDGGLGNRLFLMVSALYFAKKADKKFIIHWPSNNWCGCNFTDIFDNNYNVTNFNIKFVDRNVLGKCTLLMHESQIKHNENKIVINTALSEKEIVELMKSEPNIFYYGNQMHRSLDYDKVVDVFNDLVISERVLNMISGHDVSDCIGIHIRGTDINKKPFINTDQLEKEVAEHSKQRYFLCSDEKVVEDRFIKYDNVFSFKKTSYVEKLDISGGWNHAITDDVGRLFVFNVNRNKISSIEAFCDMLLLAKTQTRLETSGSSFLKCANLVAKTKLVK